MSCPGSPLQRSRCTPRRGLSSINTPIWWASAVFGQPGKNLVVVKPTFNMYGVFGNLNGMKTVEVPYDDDFTMPVERILDAIDDDTSIVVLVNPNMPIGNVYSPEDIEKVVRKAEEHDAL